MKTVGMEATDTAHLKYDIIKVAKVTSGNVSLRYNNVINI